MSGRVRKRSLGWRRQDPVGWGPKREIQITEHVCSKSAVYSLWTGVFDPSPSPPLQERPTPPGGPFCICAQKKSQLAAAELALELGVAEQDGGRATVGAGATQGRLAQAAQQRFHLRSEERRVGKE